MIFDDPHIQFRDGALERYAARLYSETMHALKLVGKTAQWDDLKEECREPWIEQARQRLADAIPFLQVRKPEPLVPGMRPVDRESLRDYERAMDEGIREMTDDRRRRQFGRTGMGSAGIVNETPAVKLG